MEICYQPIGTIHSPFKSIKAMPIQPQGAAGVRGTIELRPEFFPALKDLDGFSNIILLYHFHQTGKAELIVTPFLDTQPHGVFATRAPSRPNSIGLSVVRLLGIEDAILHIQNVDILDGTPLLDIKPYVPEFDEHPADRIGWMEKAKGKIERIKSDGRFG